jgi:hypothetical protein
MNPLIWIPLLTQVLIPLALLAWFASRRQRSQSAWLIEAILVASYLVAIALAGLWLTLPWYLPLVYAALFVVGLLRGRPSADRWPASRAGWVGLALRSAAALLCAGLALYALAGRRPPVDTVELAFPLAAGTYLVAAGGGNSLINPHLETLTLERARPYRGQSYGVDLVALDDWGLRASGLAPKDPAAYRIFGRSILAPCAGDVVASTDGLADLSPPTVDREHMAGNYVLLDCGGPWVLLGHMQQGSVQVQEGERVEIGQPLGRVGNTGNTGEPHLHIHAQTPGPESMPLGGDPLPIRLDGRYLARNQRVQVDE